MTRLRTGSGSTSPSARADLCRIAPSFLALMLATACAHTKSLPGTTPASGPLGWLVGEWRGTRFEPSSGERAPVTSRVRAILDGTGELEEVDIQTSKGMYHGMYTELTEPGGKSVILYANAKRRSFSRLEGEATAEGGQWLNVATEGAHRSKLVYERPSPRTWRRTQYVSEDSGQTWTVLFVDDLERRD